MKDSVVLAAEIAFKQYELGHIGIDELVSLLRKCINARAIGNGYAERFGLPCPEEDES